MTNQPKNNQKAPTLQSTMQSTGDNWMQKFTDSKIKIPDGIFSPKNSHSITRGVPTPMRVSTQVTDSKVFHQKTSTISNDPERVFGAQSVMMQMSEANNQ